MTKIEHNLNMDSKVILIH